MTGDNGWRDPAEQVSEALRLSIAADEAALSRLEDLRRLSEARRRGVDAIVALRQIDEECGRLLERLDELASAAERLAPRSAMTDAHHADRAIARFMLRDPVAEATQIVRGLA